MDRLTEIEEIMRETMSPVASEMLCDICDHYSNAIAKHPFFADDVCWKDNDWGSVARILKYKLKSLSLLRKKGETTNCLANDVLDAELAEVYDAYNKGDYDQAIEEVYDAIAVLLRMEDMIAEKQMEDGKC